MKDLIPVKLRPLDGFASEIDGRKKEKTTPGDIFNTDLHKLTVRVD